MEFRCARILLLSHRFGCLEHPGRFHDLKPALVAQTFSCTADLYHAEEVIRWLR